VLDNPVPSNQNSEFYPELIPRRGEFVAWILTLVAISAWIVTASLGNPVHPTFKILAIFLILSALAISFSNWNDRHTIIHIRADQIWFKNGLRQVKLNWDDITQVQVFPSRWGKKVHIMGEREHFNFRTLGIVEYHNQVKGRMGFSEGEAILNHILDASHLKPINKPGEGYYYVRE